MCPSSLNILQHYAFFTFPLRKEKCILSLVPAVLKTIQLASNSLTPHPIQVSSVITRLKIKANAKIISLSSGGACVFRALYVSLIDKHLGQCEYK